MEESDVEGVEDRLDDVGVAVEPVANQLERANLIGERIAERLQLIPLAMRLGVWEIAHHLHDVGAIALVEVERAVGVRLGGLQAEMVPEGERRAIDFFALKRAVHALLTIEAACAEDGP